MENIVLHAEFKVLNVATIPVIEQCIKDEIQKYKKEVSVLLVDDIVKRAIAASTFLEGSRTYITPNPCCICDSGISLNSLYWEVKTITIAKFVVSTEGTDVSVKFDIQGDIDWENG